MISACRKTVFAGATVCAVLLVVVALAELALRARHQDVSSITGVTEWRNGSYEDITYYWDRYDPRLGWTNQPGYRSDDRVPFRITINEQGLRADHEYAAEPAEGITRIAVVGDSTTFGEEVDDQQTLPVYLEQRLPDSEILNFGVHGYGAGQMLLLLEERVFDYRPDLVVVVYLTLDVFRDTEAEFVHPKPIFTVEDGRLELRNVPVPEATRQPWLLRHCFTAAWLWGRPDVTPDRAGDVDHAALLAAILRRMKEAGDAHGVPVVPVHLIDRNTLEAARRDPTFRSAVDTMRRVVLEADDALDLSRLLDEAQRADPSGLTERHGHWSARGNALIASRIALHLKQRGLYPASRASD